LEHQPTSGDHSVARLSVIRCSSRLKTPGLSVSFRIVIGWKMDRASYLVPCLS